MGYAVKLLSVRPPGKESWIEEALYSMAFHAICLTVVLPLFIMAIVKNWHVFRRWWYKLFVIVAMMTAMALIVVLPEYVVNRVREKRATHVEVH